MSGFPSYEAVSAALFFGLLGFAAGASWGRRQGRAEADRLAHEETERVLRNTAVWHQRAQTLRRGPEDATPDERPRGRRA